MSLSADQIKNIIEAALMAAGQPLSIDRLLSLFLDEYQPTRDEIRQALSTLAEECENRGVELKEISSGFRFQAKQDYAQWVARLWEEKPARYSRALLETLALIAYRQPITRGEIEDIRGVSVSSNIMKTLQEREWVKVVGHRDVPGKPAMYATTKQFLDYFGLKGLTDLPTLAEIRDIDSINAELDLAEPGAEGGEGEAAEEVPSEMLALEGEAPEAQQADSEAEEAGEQAADTVTQENSEQTIDSAESESEAVETPRDDEEEDSATTPIVDSA
jgi:segregation and condensation protein B